MADLIEWLCPACGHHWRHRDEQTTCPKCHAGIGTDYPVPDISINAGTGMCPRCNKALDDHLWVMGISHSASLEHACPERVR